MSDDGVRGQWREWARGQSIPPDRLEPRWRPPLLVAASGAEAAAAAARLAGGRALAADGDVLRARLARTGVVLEELAGVPAGGAVSADVVGAVAAAFERRRQALAGVLASATLPVPAAAPAAGAAGPAPAAPPVPAGPSLREFFGEHSILLLSYVGAFLLIVAAVLYELYAIGELSGGPRFAGALGLDAVLGAAGWACLRSRRMRLVGHTYVAIFALLAPLVAVAAYVFLGLGGRGISVATAQLVTGAALTALYGVLCLRLGSRAYGFLALAALPVAWLGAIEVGGAGAWDGPAGPGWWPRTRWSGRAPGASPSWARGSRPGWRSPCTGRRCWRRRCCSSRPARRCPGRAPRRWR